MTTNKQTKRMILEWPDDPKIAGVFIRFEDDQFNRVGDEQWHGIKTMEEAPALSREQAQEMLDEVMKDVRPSYPPANPIINIQLELETKRDLLKLFLGVE